MGQDSESIAQGQPRIATTDLRTHSHTHTNIYTHTQILIYTHKHTHTQTVTDMVHPPLWFHSSLLRKERT